MTLVTEILALLPTLEQIAVGVEPEAETLITQIEALIAAHKADKGAEHAKAQANEAAQEPSA